MKKLLAASAAFFVLAGLALGQGYPQNNAKRIWGLNIAIPAAGDDGQFLRYNHATGYSWEGMTLTSALLSATHTDTTAAAVSRGALITGQGASPAWTLLAKGTAGQLLTMGADEPGWAAAPAEADTLATVTGRGATTDTAVGLNGGLSVDTPAFVVANATGAVSTTAMPTVAIAGGNAATEALQLTHTTPSVAAETAATLAISFDFVNSIDSGAGQEEAARIEVYKWGDWYNVSPNDDDDDSGLKLYTTQDGDQTLRLTVGDGTSALNVAAVNPAGGSATAVTINPTLGIMDGSDAWTGVSIVPTNADHTGASNTVTGVSVGAITGDADATETAVSIGSGWDVGLSTASPMINSYTSLVSSPAKSLTGSWYSGGTATTTKPHILIEPTGATSTGWSTSGTGLGINAASGFVGNLLDLQLNGTSKAKVDSTGQITTSGRVLVGTTTPMDYEAGTSYPAQLTVHNAGANDYALIGVKSSTAGGYTAAVRAESHTDAKYVEMGAVDDIAVSGTKVANSISWLNDTSGNLLLQSNNAGGYVLFAAGAATSRTSIKARVNYQGYIDISGTVPICWFDDDIYKAAGGNGSPNTCLWHSGAHEASFYGDGEAPIKVKAGSYDASGSVTAGTGFVSGTSSGVTTVVTVRDSGGAADCTMTFTGGILTATTCSHT